MARKLAMVLHRLWIPGQVYQALGYGRAEERAIEFAPNFEMPHDLDLAP